MRIVTCSQIHTVILAIWKKYFPRLLNVWVRRVSDIRQIEIYKAEPLLRCSNSFEVEIAITKLKKYTSLDNDQIPAELIQAGDEILQFVIHKVITSLWNNEYFLDYWRKSIIVPISKRGDKSACSHYGGLSLLSTSYEILSIILS
jgi:hypothetical protein